MKLFLTKHILHVAIIIFVLLNVGVSFLTWKLDCSDDQKFTLTKASVSILLQLQSPVQITIFMDGKIKATDKNFVKSLEELLIDFQDEAKGNLRFKFINPFATIKNDTARFLLIDSLNQMGLKPYSLKTQETSLFEQRQSIIIPGAIIEHNGEKRAINFFEGLRVQGGEEGLFTQAIAALEYQLMSAIDQLSKKEKPKIYFSSAHGEPLDIRMVDFFQSVAQQYNIDTLNLLSSPMPQDANILMLFFPNSPYTEDEKMKIDHFVMQGGKVFFAINSVTLNENSKNQDLLFIPFSSGTDDLLFKYGCRLEYHLIKDLQCAAMPMVVGDVGSKPQIEPVNWPYYPLLNPNPEHIITRNLDPVYAKYANWISEVGDESIQKTILLYTSQKSQTVGTPALVNLSDARKLDPILFTKSRLPVAYLLEGHFSSLYHDRLLPETRSAIEVAWKGKWQKTSPHTQIIVLANPQIFINEIKKQGIVPMGYAESMNFSFANKSFLLNCLQYLTNPNGLILARQKDIQLQMLNSDRVLSESKFWIFINISIPIFVLLILAFMVKWIRLK